MVQTLSQGTTNQDPCPVMTRYSGLGYQTERVLTNEKSAKDCEHIDYLKWNHKTDKLLIGGRSSVKNNMMLSVFDLSKNAYLTQKPLTTNMKDAQSTNVSFLKSSFYSDLLW